MTHKLFFLLESNRIHDSSVFDELVCLTLLMLRYIHVPSSVSDGEAPILLNASIGNAAPTVLYPFLMRLLKSLFKVTDSVLQTRVFAEFATLLLDATIDPVLPGTSSAEQKYDFSKNAVSLLLNESDKMDIRLIVSIFRVLERGLLLTSQVLMDFQALLQASSEADKDALVVPELLSSLPTPNREQHSTVGSKNDDSDHPWAVFDHEIFLSKNRLYRYRLTMLNDASIGPPNLEEEWVQESLKELREYLCRLLQGGVYVIKLCSLK